MENRIKEFVKSLGISPELNGYRYIVAAILYIKQFDSPSNVSITKMYEDLGAKFDTTAPAMERSIHHAISRVMGTSEGIENLREVLKFPFTNAKISNSKFLALCADMID